MDISAESYPDYDGFGWDNYWSCTDWMIWYGKLKQAYGVSEAKLRWKSAWEKQDNTSNPYLWCMYSDDFYEFIREEELGLSNTLADVSSGVGTGVTGIFKGFGWIGRNIVWLAPAVLIIAGAGYGWKFYKELK